MSSKYARRHYEDVAQILYTLRIEFPALGNEEKVAMYDRLFEMFTLMFSQDNERFDSARFTRAAFDGKGRGRV